MPFPVPNVLAIRWCWKRPKVRYAYNFVQPWEGWIIELWWKSWSDFLSEWTNGNQGKKTHTDSYIVDGSEIPRPTTTGWMVKQKSLLNHGPDERIPTSSGEFAGFLNHQQNRGTSWNCQVVVAKGFACRRTKMNWNRTLYKYSILAKNKFILSDFSGVILDSHLEGNQTIQICGHFEELPL